MFRHLWKYFLLLQLLLEYLNFCISLTITMGHCHKNVTIKYQQPITKTRLNHQNNATEYFVEFEEQERMDTVKICCAGYRTIIFGLCEPICSQKCPANSYCAEPDKCVCLKGYEESHNHHVRSISSNSSRQIHCRPICTGGCPKHSHCVSHNHCSCRSGFRDTSSWFTSVPKCERIQCPTTDQAYDAQQHKCIKLELNLEKLMQQVGEKLAMGINSLDYDNEDSEAEEYENESNRNSEHFMSMQMKKD